MPSEPPSALLDRVRKLLAKAEAEGVTPPEAEALTAKAAELMARYGIDRARLAAARPDTDRPGSRVIDIDNPWGQVRAHLLAGLAGAMRCQCVLLSTTKPGARIHVFGYASDLERADILYTSLLLQMARGLAAELAARLRHRRHHPGQVSRGPGRRERGGRDAVRAQHRPGPGRSGRGHPPAAGTGVPGDPPDPDYLQRTGLQRRLRPGAAGRHRQRPAQVSPGPHPRLSKTHPRLSRARKMASVPWRCGQNWANLGYLGSGPRRAGTSGRTAGASKMVMSSRLCATAVTTSRVSARCGEHVT